LAEECSELANGIIALLAGDALQDWVIRYDLGDGKGSCNLYLPWVFEKFDETCQDLLIGFGSEWMNLDDVSETERRKFDCELSVSSGTMNLGHILCDSPAIRS
jgi:hypothetical protein